MIKYIKTFGIAFLFCTVLIIPIMVFVADAGAATLGEEIQGSVDSLGEGAGFTPIIDAKTALPKKVGNIINAFMYLLGTLFMVLIIYGGYSWMTSYGNVEKTKKAKELIVDAVIGLAIILAAYAISNFVVSSLVKATL